MATASTSTWISFFKEAGIPAGVAATYALTFCDNRIQMDMLLELNKEYLRDMGITLMGDVIAILRHAKRVHEQTAREKILGNTNVRTININTSESTGNKEEIKVKSTNSMPRAIQKKVTRVASEAAQPPVVKKKIVKTKLNTTPTQPSESEVKKIRRVLPEHEGRYKITMPSGSTPRTKEILAKMKTISPPKKTVFDRLGSDGVVTSTTETENPRITITGLGNNIVKTGNDKPSSVFMRLGEKSQAESSTTPPSEINVDEDDGLKSEPDKTLPYVGILKSQPKVTGKSIIAVTTEGDLPTMHADKVTGGVIKKFRTNFNSESNRKTGSFRITNTSGILGNHLNNPKLNVKARLGYFRSNESLGTVAPRKKYISTISDVSNDNSHDSNDGSSAKKRVTFGGVSSVYPKEQDQFKFPRLHSDFNAGRGPRRGGVFNRLSL